MTAVILISRLGCYKVLSKGIRNFDEINLLIMIVGLYYVYSSLDSNVVSNVCICY